MSKHTPGPWQVGMAFDNYGETEIAIEHMTPAGNLVVAVALGGLQGQDANARLIAAAPDLLEALKWYESKAKQMGRAAIHQDSKLMLELMKEVAVEYGAQARAAIAKATGD